MGGVYGVKETKEALLALTVLGAFVAKRMKDGVDLGDAIALGQKLIAEGPFKEKVMAGIDGYDKIMLEIGELDLADYMELGKGLPDMIGGVKAA